MNTLFIAPFCLIACAINIKLANINQGNKSDPSQQIVGYTKIIAIEQEN
jgi:hypothetical protein